MRNWSYDLAFLFRKNVETEGVALVCMDETSHRRLKVEGASYDSGWERSLHAALLRKLTIYGAKAAVFDIHFEKPANPEKDDELIQAAKSHGKVAVAEFVEPQTTDSGLIVWAIAEPFAALKAVTSPGLVEMALMKDPSVRRHFTVESDEPTLACRTAELTMTNPPPRHPDRARWVNYYGPPMWLPHYGYFQVLSNELINPVAVFSNKVVFVGANVAIGPTGGLPTEYFRTPYTLWGDALSPGVEINATTYLNLLRGDWLTELPLWLECVLLIFGGAGLGYGLTQCHPMRAAGLGLGVAVVVAALGIGMVWSTGFWFPWLIVSGVQAPVAVGWAVLAYTKRFRQEQAERKGAVLEPITDTIPIPADAAAEAAAFPGFVERYVQASPGLSSGFKPLGARGNSQKIVTPPPIPDHTLIRCIGQGSYGQVWLARDAIGTYHAVKVVYRDNFRDATPFDREFRGIQKFTPISRSHPGFVHILHVGRNEEAGCFYYIMELGDDIETGQRIQPNTYEAQNLARKLKKQGKLSIDECIRLSLDLTSALDHLHSRQLIHRDIKPSNIIFVNQIPKFADIGLVTDIVEQGGEITLVGTQGYLAPEGPGTPAADVYSLGKLLYEASTGFDRARFPELPSALMETENTPQLFKLNKIVLIACETDPKRRYPSAAAMREDLLRLQEETPPEKKPRLWKR